LTDIIQLNTADLIVLTLRNGYQTGCRSGRRCIALENLFTRIVKENCSPKKHSFYLKMTIENQQMKDLISDFIL
jgi:hypothetical protein